MRTVLSSSLAAAVCLCAGVTSAQDAGDGASAIRRADDRDVVVLFVGQSDEASPARHRVWRTHVERAARIAGLRVVEDPESWAVERSVQDGPVSPARLDAFRRVEELLLAARADAASLREGDALRRLATAERLSEAHAGVPGASAWIAEVQISIGTTAAQAGRERLMEVAFARAATLDPTRRVRAAEAPPSVVQRAEEIRRAVANRPSGSFEVVGDLSGARIFLDDAELGATPRLVRAPVGRHVLRLEAPGHLPYGRVIDVVEGRSPPVRVRLSPDPILSTARRLPQLAERGDVGEAVRALNEMRLSALWLVEVGAGPRDRALLTTCAASGCGRPRGIEVDEVPILVARTVPLPAAEVQTATDMERAWLAEPAPPPPPPPPAVEWWERWYVWAAIGVAAATTTGVVVHATRDDAEQRRRVIIDFGD